MKKILFLYHRKSSDYISQYANKHFPDVEVTLAEFDDLSFSINTENERKVKVTLNNKDLKDFDYVMFKKYSKKSIEVIYSSALYLKFNGVKFANEISLRMLSHGKLAQMVMLACSGFDVPQTVYIGKNKLDSLNEIPTNSSRFILKSTSSTFGDDNYLFDNINQAKEIINNNQESNYIFQEYLENNGDYRIFCVNYEPKSICIRKRKDDSIHVNNTSKGGSYEYIPLAENIDLVNVSEKVSKLFGIGISGVDIIKGQNNKNYILEVNVNPGYTKDLNFDEELDYIIREMIS